jgi:hypothetical protein
MSDKEYSPISLKELLDHITGIRPLDKPKTGVIRNDCEN